MKSITLVVPCKNPGENFSDTIQLWLAQEVPDHLSYSIIIVDDGSSVLNLSSKLQKDARVTVLRNEVTRGRASARNFGASAARGGVIVFADADCTPQGPHIINEYYCAMKNSDLCVGLLTSFGNGFWGRYFREIAKRRRVELGHNSPMAFTSANFAIKKAVFNEVSGFDERYEAYGFEDKDFVSRLVEIGVVPFVVFGATLEHAGDESLEKVSIKIYEAGRYSSAIFMERHFNLYREMGYYNADSRLRLAPRLLASIPFGLTFSFVKLCSVIVDSESSITPYSVKRALVKVCMFMCYCKGTSDAKVL